MEKIINGKNYKWKKIPDRENSKSKTLQIEKIPDRKNSKSRF